MVVLTDVRSAARAQELEEELPALLGARPLFVQVPRVGEVAALRALLETRLKDPEVVPTSERRARALLAGLALPELRGALVARRAALERTEDTRRHLEGFVSLGQETVASLQRLSAEARLEVSRDLGAGLEAATEATRQDIAALAEGMDWFLWETYRDEVVRTVQARTDTFHAQASETLDEALRRLSEQCNAILVDFEQAVSMPAELANVPGLDFAKDAAFSLAAGRVARKALAYVERMGARGGAALGTVNVARRAVARFYRLGGRKAPAELIRRGVPRVVRPVGQLLKFVAKRIGSSTLPSSPFASSGTPAAPRRPHAT